MVVEMRNATEPENQSMREMVFSSTFSCVLSSPFAWPFLDVWRRFWREKREGNMVTRSLAWVYA